MEWFEKLTGFQESDYESTRAQLGVTGTALQSAANGRSFQIGQFELVTLRELRQRAGTAPAPSNPGTFSVIRSDVRPMHSLPVYSGALFQVASQCNALEMVGPTITPEDGVTRYAFDRTQGPACAIAAGAATIYRNYFVPVDGQVGQTRKRQLDSLASLGRTLSALLGSPVHALWDMRNGYAMCTRAGLDAISRLLADASAEQIDELRAEIGVAVQWDVEVTDGLTGSGDSDTSGPLVSQVFCSALPVGYSDVAARHWAPFATLVLEAIYEATLLAASCNASRGGSSIVLLTSVGGGAFGNDPAWIYAAMRRALASDASRGLDIRLVSYQAPSPEVKRLEAEFRRDA